MIHPRTAALSDSRLPEVAALLGTHPPAALSLAVDLSGGEIDSAKLTQVSWSPGRSLTLRYTVQVNGGEAPGAQGYVVVAGRIPDGALIVEAEDLRVGVWRFPHDPALPALPSALDGATAADVIVGLGGTPGEATTFLRAYRPGRRAVVEVRGGSDRVFFKVVRPKTIEKLHRIHRTLAEVLPVPASLGYDEKLGLVVLQSLPGSTLRDALAHPDTPVPDPALVASMVADLPHPQGLEDAHSPLDRAQQMMRLLNAICPELGERLDGLAEAMGPEGQEPTRPVHGDYYESQIMVEGGSIVGMLDVDTYGLGRPADDPATMLAHLSVWGPVSPQPDRVRTYGNALLRIWDTAVDPVDLRRRAAANALLLATGPFRVQSANWPAEVAQRVAIAELWAESARRVDEKTLMPFSD